MMANVLLIIWCLFIFYVYPPACWDKGLNYFHKALKTVYFLKKILSVRIVFVKIVRRKKIGQKLK